MCFLDLAKKRYSCRKFTDQSIDQDTLNMIIEAAHVAPSGANRQATKLIVVQEKTGHSKLNMGANTHGAPLCVIVCGDTSKIWVRPSDHKSVSDFDAAIIADHIMLQAAELGLASVCICQFNEDIVADEFDMPRETVPICILALGYPAEDPPSADRHVTLRKPINDLVAYECYDSVCSTTESLRS